MNRPHHSRLDEILRETPATAKPHRGNGVVEKIPGDAGDVNDLNLIEDLLIGSDLGFSGGIDHDWALPEFFGDDFEAATDDYVDTDEMRAARDAILSDVPPMDMPLAPSSAGQAEARPETPFQRATLDDILGTAGPALDEASVVDNAPHEAPVADHETANGAQVATESAAAEQTPEAVPQREGFFRNILRRTGLLHAAPPPTAPSRSDNHAPRD